MCERKLYIEYRLHFNPNANQETLREMALAFQEHIHDEWNNTLQSPIFDVTDVTYEMVMEVTCRPEGRKNCYSCNTELSTDPNNTSSYRTDGYCSAKCKRKDRFGEMKERKQEIERRFNNE